MFRYLWCAVSVAAALVVATEVLPATVADATPGTFVCTSGATFTVTGPHVDVVGQGSCVDRKGNIISMSYTGAGGGARTLLCLPVAPVVTLPPINVRMTLNFDFGLHPQTFHLKWSTIAPLGAPVYAATISGQGGGVVAGVAISGAPSCGSPVTTQGPVAITFLSGPLVS